MGRLAVLTLKPRLADALCVPALALAIQIRILQPALV